MKNFLTLALFLFSMCNFIQAQDPTRFQEELKPVLEESQAETDRYQDRVLFTGSSSIRMWENVAEYFPDHAVLNRGFGGSEMSDLVYYVDQLVLKYRPRKIFIYEGDNDIANGELPGEIINEAKALVATIRESLPETPIVFISAKPSISRWELKDSYLELNEMLREMCQSGYKLEYADTWSIMLDAKGDLQQDLFIEDDLHMNAKGYDLWARVIGRYMPAP